MTSAEPHDYDPHEQTLTANRWTISARSLWDSIIPWGLANYQDFPWRGVADPYRVLIAEVMLHRTRAPQVVPVYIEFIESYPTIENVARASVGELEDSMRSLGLLWRVEKLHSLAHTVMNEFGGRLPDSYDELVSLPGVSHYIASAIRCFSGGEAVAIVDTNTLRILSRLFGLSMTDSSRRTKAIHALMGDILDRERPMDFNYAMLDLAHQICVAKVPLCHECPILKVPCRYGTGQLRL